MCPPTCRVHRRRAQRGADAIIVDLGKRADRRTRPRGATLSDRRNVARGGADVIVRINRPWRQTCWTSRPRSAAGAGLAVTKVDSADHIKLIAES
jgi:citrate lyase subunit beta/citryl-CoA lyase